MRESVKACLIVGKMSGNQANRSRNSPGKDSRRQLQIIEQECIPYSIASLPFYFQGS
jgi:hypothetical protein